MILSRIAFAIPVLFVMTFLTFFLASLIPGNVALVILGPSATAERVTELTASLGLDRPIFEQYLRWLSDALHGDLGTSIYTGEPVLKTIGQRFWPTMTLSLVAAIVSGLIGIVIGVYAALRGGFLSRALDTLGMLGIALPNFWIALLLIVLFSGTLGLLPAIGYVKPTDDVGGWIQHLILPVGALTLAGIALVAKQTRDAYSDALSRDFMRFMQANGVSRSSLLYRHGLRHASVPIVASVVITFINFFSATATLEVIFAIPGLGAQVALSTTNHDLSVLQGVVVTYTIVTIVVTLLADIVYSLLNPKVGTR
jgi:peptide/nickel transport system permease protein